MDTATTLVELLCRRAQTEPERVAYTFLEDSETESGHLTWGDLDRRARAIAAELQSRSQAGDRILMLYPQGLDFIEGFFGCLYAGLLAVPAYPPQTHKNISRLRAIVRDAEARLTLTTAGLQSSLEAFPGFEEALGSSLLASDRIEDAEADGWQRPALQGEDLAFLQYTSGSTGEPKGVMVSHANLLVNLEDLDRSLDHSRDSVMVTWLPTFHDMGLIYGVLQPLYREFSCYLMSPKTFLKQPIQWLKAISNYRGTHSSAPNFAFDLCVQRTTEEERQSLDLSSWRRVGNGAEPIRLSTLQRFAEVFGPCGFGETVFCPGYGLAEATLKVSGLRPREPVFSLAVDREALERHEVAAAEPGSPNTKIVVSCGRSAIGTEIAVVDPETRRRCVPERVGELWLAGPAIAQGYWRQDEATAETFHASLAGEGDKKFLRTGDLGFVHQDHLVVTGRLKDMIILRGRNHYPHDIVASLRDVHPGLRTGCGTAFSVETSWGEGLVVVHEVRGPLDEETAREVLELVRTTVAREHQIAAHAVVLIVPRSLDKTSSGKVQNWACKASYLRDKLKVVASWTASETTAVPVPEADHLTDGEGQPSAPSIQLWLTTWLAGRLGRTPDLVPTNKPFADFGLDSVQGVELVQELEKWLGPRPELNATAVWNFPTIEALAQQLAEPEAELEVAAAGVQESVLPASKTAEDVGSYSDAELLSLLAKEVEMAQGEEG